MTTIDYPRHDDYDGGANTIIIIYSILPYGNLATSCSRSPLLDRQYQNQLYLLLTFSKTPLHFIFPLSKDLIMAPPLLGVNS